MMINKYFYFVLYFTSFVAFAQQGDVSNIKAQLKKTSDLKEKINLLNSLAEKYSLQNTDSIFYYANQAHQLSEQKHYNLGKAEAWINLSTHYYFASEFDSVNYFSLKAIDGMIQLKDSSGLSKAYNNYGFALERQGKVNQAEEFYLLAIGINEKINENKTHAKALTNLANIKSSKGQFDKALVMFQKAKKIAVKYEDFHQQGNIFNGQAITYERQGKLDSTLLYLDQAEEIYERLNLQGNLFVVNNNKGSVYRKKSNLAAAIIHYKKAIDKAKSQNNKRHQSIGYNNLGICYLDLEETENALPYFEKAAQLSEKLDLYTYAVSRFNIALILKNIPKRKQEAKQILTETLNYFDEQELFSSKIPILNSLAEVYFDESQVNLAKKTYNKSIEIGEEYGSYFDLLFAYNGLSEIALQEEKLDSTIYFANQVIEIDEAKINIEALSFAYQMLSKAYQRKGDYEKALNYFEQHKELSKSIFNEEKSKEIGRAEVENEFNLEQERIALAADNKLLERQTKIKTKNIQLGILTSVLFIIFLLVLVLYLKNKKQRTQQKKLKLIYQKIETKNKQLQLLDHQKNQLFNLVAKDLKEPLNKLLERFKKLNTEELIQQNKEEVSGLLEDTLSTTNNLLSWASQEMREKSQLDNQEKISVKKLIESVVHQLSEKIKKKKVVFQVNNELNQNTALASTTSFSVLYNLLSVVLDCCIEEDEAVLSIKASENDLVFYLRFPSQRMPLEMEKKLTTNLEKEKNQDKNDVSIYLVKDIIEKKGGKIWLIKEQITTKLCFSFAHQELVF